MGDRKDACPDCGKPKGIRAARCRPCRDIFAVGENHGCWKGGRIIDGDGYVRLYTPDDPRANMGRYMKEHILVMEAHLGRLLVPGEEIHHRNGVRSDNRLENLELWVTSQPAGQRPEDLVAWAKEILERYGT